MYVQTAHYLLDCIVLFLNPRRPNIRSFQRGSNWIYVSWLSDHPRDNVTSYEVKYSYVGPCVGISQRITTRRVYGNESHYNITGLGEFFNYSINLTAINGTGRSPPNIAFARTLPDGMTYNFLLLTSVVREVYNIQWLFVCIHLVQLHPVLQKH